MTTGTQQRPRVWLGVGLTAWGCAMLISACVAPTAPSRNVRLYGPPPAPAPAPAPSRAAGLAAFDEIYKVLMHPRCLNCHPTGDRPLQFSDARPHAMNVQRGPDDRGRAGMRCTTCHQKQNGELPNQPPGVATDWHMAPRSMAFQGRSKRQLAEQLKDSERSHMTTEELMEHVHRDPLVVWGWNPGPGREPVPVPHDEFVKAVQTWIQAGQPLPEEDE